MSHNRMTIEQLKVAFPMPWKYMVAGIFVGGPSNGNGRIVVVDQQGKEVPMFNMLDFAVDFTARIAAQDFIKTNPQASQPTGAPVTP